ncbi:unnamed protein product [Closterium sp. NIES-53]
MVDLFGTPHAMYAVVDSSASDSIYSSVVSLGASLAEVPVASVVTCVDTSPGAAPEDASLSFTLDFGASHCFFRDCTTLTPLPTPVSVALADPISGLVTARYTTTLPCPAVPSCSLTGFHIPSFSRNLVGVRPLVSQHVGVWIEPSGETAVCVDGDTAAAAAAAAAAEAAAVAAEAAAATAPDPCHCPSSVAASCSCRSLAHPSVLWHHWMGHPSISRLRAMSSQRLVLGLPRVLPWLPPSLAPPCGPCVEGRLRATLHSSSLRPANEPFETLHLDVWGPASRPGLERESFFLVVVDDYSRYTTVFPLVKKSNVTSTLIQWLLTTADTRGRRVSCLHSDRRGEFFSGILARLCREQGTRQSPQQNGVAERRIGLVMEIARTSMTHTRAPHFLWPYAVRYAAHQLNLWPRVSRPEDSSDYTFCHPPLHRFFDSRDIRFDESVSYYVRYPCRGLPVPPVPLFLTSAPPPAPPVQPPPLGPAPSDPAGAGFRGEDPGGASSRGAGVGAESVPVRGPGSGGAGVGAEPVTAGDSSLWGAGVSGAIPGGTTTRGAPSAGPGEPGTDPVTSGATTAPDTTPPPQPYPTRHQARVCRAREEQLQLEREERELERQQLELQRLEEQQQPKQEQSQQQSQQQPQQRPPPPPVSGLWTLGLPSPSPPSPPSPPISGPPLPPPDTFPAVSPPPLPPLSPPLSHTWPLRRSPRARPSSLVPFTDLRTALFCSSPPRLSPSVLPSPPESALTASLFTPVTDYYRMYRPVLPRVLASLVTDPRASLFSVSALTAAVTELASTRCLDYATSLVAAPPTSPLAVGGESALGCVALEDRQFELEFLAAASPHLCAILLAPEGDPDALDIPTPRTYAEAVLGPWASQWRAAMDSEMTSYRSTCTYVDEVPPLGANVVNDMWIFRVKRPPGSPPVFKARYVAKGFTQRGYELHSLDFSTVFLQGSLHEEVWLHRPSAFTCTFPPGTQWRLRRPVYGHRQAPREWHDTLRSTLSDLGFQPSSADPSVFVRRGSTPFFVLVYVDDLVFATADRVALADVLQRFELQHSTVQRTRLAVDHRLTGPFLDEPFEPSGPYAELVGCLMYLITCTRSDLAFPFSILARFVAPGRHRPVHWTVAVRVAKRIGLLRGTVSAWALELFRGAMAAQELCWLTFLLTDLGERPSSAPTLFTDNKATILLCQEPRLESRMKHINVRYFLLLELQRRGQARFNFVESEANTVDIFTKALPPCDHLVQLGLVDTGSRLA